MQVKQIAQSLSVSADTVRYYTRIGYLSPARNLNNGYKEYGQKDVDRMRFILGARQLGFSVEDIGLFIKEAGKGRTACPMVRNLVSHRLKETEARFKEAQALRNRMKKAVREWEDKPNKVPTGNMVCHLIENFNA